MLTLGVDAAVADDGDGQDAVRVLPARQHADDGALVCDGAHGHVVHAGLEDEVREQGSADGDAFDGEIHGYVAQVHGENGGVGDRDGAEEVGAVGFGGEFDVNGGYVEAVELVEAFDVFAS